MYDCLFYTGLYYATLYYSRIMKFLWSIQILHKSLQLHENLSWDLLEL